MSVLIQTPVAKLKVKINGKPLMVAGKPAKIAYNGPETDPERIKAHILRATKISLTTRKMPDPKVEADGEIELTNPDGTPFAPEPTQVQVQQATPKK